MQRALALLHGQGGKPSRAAEASDGDRARALLEGRSAKSADKAAFERLQNYNYHME